MGRQIGAQNFTFEPMSQGTTFFKEESMKMNVRIVVLGTVFSVLTGTVQAQTSHWKRWSEKDAKKIVKKATEFGGHSGLRMFGNMMKSATIGALGGAKAVLMGTQNFWLTDDVCWALARIQQIKERRTDQEVVAIHDECREKSDTHYMLILSATKIAVWRSYFGGGTQVEQTAVDPEKLGQMFLQHKKNNKIFLRAAEASTFQKGVIVLFPRDDKFMEGQKEIQLQVTEGNGKVKANFKLKDLIPDGDYSDL